MSPSFISADDAAYWAHRSMVPIPEWEYGGVVLQAADGLFYATQPKRGAMVIFDYADVLALDEQHFPVAPKGFTLHALYRSHQAMHKEFGTSTGLPDKDVRLILSAFNRSDMLNLLHLGDRVRVNYVTGPDGSLLKYVVSASAVERVLFKRLQDEYRGVIEAVPFTYPHSFILDCAAAGELRVVVPNDDWGGVRGRVPANWTPGTAVASVVEEAPLCTSVFDLEAAAVNAALSRIKGGGQGYGFVLQSKQLYVATLPLPVGQPLFSLARCFPKDPAGHFMLHTGWHLQGAYTTVRGDEVQGARLQEAWLHKVLFSAGQLAAGIGIMRERATPEHAASVYFKMIDGALLRYGVSGSLKEAALLHETSPGDARDDGSDDRFRDGSLSAREYVLRVATAGVLEVIQTSAVWDVAAKVGANWTPYALRQPPLSPAFVTADDAARYAHQQVAHKRQLTYAALILQRADQRFVVTQPRPSERPRFALDGVYPLDHRGKPIMLTPGCQLHGVFWSRPTSPPLPGVVGVELQVAEHMFMDTDIYALLTHREVVQHAYLSSSANSLIAYTSGGLEAYPERELFERVTPQDGSSQAAQELAEGLLLPSAFVREQAYPGRLRVLLDSPLWGPVGALPQDWEPASDSHGALLPEPLLLGPVFNAASAAVLDAHAQGRKHPGRLSSGLGLVLKHRTQAQYVTTQRVAPDRLAQLYQSWRFATSLEQQGFDVDSLYYSSVQVPAGLSTARRWLARHFISPTELQASRRLLDKAHVLHIATLEGALLDYEVGSRKHAEPDWPSLSLLLDDAALSVRDLVIQAASHGQLQVKVASECWDEPGAVGTNWLPFSRIARRRLSPAFSTADDAARYVLRRLGERRDKVYGGLILRSVAGLFVATEPLAVHVEYFDPQWVRLAELVSKGLFLGGSTVAAFYHSRVPFEPPFALEEAQRDVYANMFSTAFMAQVFGELGEATTNSRRADYLLCPDGALLCYHCSGSPLEQALAAQLRAPSAGAHNGIEQQIRAGTLTPSEWVNRLAGAGELRILEGSGLWGHARKIQAFSAYPAPGAREVDIGLTPLFTQAADAAWYVHRLGKGEANLTFGFILKASAREHFQASWPLPLEVSGSLTLAQVFQGGVLPQGYRVSGVYLRSVISPESADSALARSFFAVQDLAMGLNAAVSADRVPLYLSCGDGALLRLDAPNTDKELATPEAAALYARRLQTGAVTQLSYLRRIAGAGTLRVLQGSAFWFETTLVTQQWEPGKACPTPPTSDRRFVMGPLFLHADDAARHTQRQTGPYAGDDYLGVILEDLDQRTYVATEPLKDNDTQSSVEERLFWTTSRDATSDHYIPLPQYPQGYTVVMTHQLYKSDFVEQGTGPVTSLDTYFVSWALIYRYSRRLRHEGFHIESYYLSTRDGALLKYTPDYSGDSLENDMVAQLNQHEHYTAADLLALMGPCATLSVVRAGSFWTQTGLIGGAPHQPVEAPSTVIPPVAAPEDSFHRSRDEF